MSRLQEVTSPIVTWSLPQPKYLIPYYEVVTLSSNNDTAAATEIHHGIDQGA